MTPVFRVVYRPAGSLIADSRIACNRHILAKPNEIIEQVIDETWDSNLFCDDCQKQPKRKSPSVRTGKSTRRLR